MNILLFLIVLFVLVLVHEFGHFIVAKLAKMRVDEFGIGFPPRLFGIRKGETVYSLNIFPIGGFVKIFGEDISGGSNDKGQTKEQQHGESARMGTAKDEPYVRSFTARPKWMQALVLIAGVAMNVLLAWCIFVAVLAIGVPTAVSEDEASPNAALVVTDVLAQGPASDADIPVGARVVSLRANDDELTTFTPSAFQQFITEHDDNALTFSYEAGSERRETALAPRTGVIEGEPSRPAIGIAFSMIETVSRPFPEAVVEATTLTFSTLRAITVGIGTLLWDALRFDADLSQVAGPIGIVGLVGEASAFGFVTLLMFTAFISLNLAVINLLPFPALDGGRLLFVAIEAVKGSPINPTWAAALNTAGFALLILLMIAVTFNDVARII